MRVAEINMVPFGSTGKIMFQIADCVRASGGEARTYATCLASKRYIKPPKAPSGHHYYGSYLGNTAHAVLARYSGKNCFYSHHSTKKLIADLEAFDPDIVHLHNLHAAYINFQLFFEWLKEKKIKVVWTFHDCWPFTAKCPHFELCCCEKWKSGCNDCPQLSSYPAARKDVTAMLWEKKRAWFTQLPYLHIVTPSAWLAGLVKQSFLRDFPVTVINNGIDLSVFRPTESSFRAEHGCEDKFVLLGVANPWSNRKGLEVFIKLAERLDDRFQIVLVGAEPHDDRLSNKKIIPIRATQNGNELAAIYSAADLFVNPTREDNYPTVNMEAIACGTPVVTFKTGGSPEMLSEKTGVSVPKDDIDALEQAIRKICADRPFSREDCVRHASSFDKGARFKQYYALFEELLKG